MIPRIPRPAAVVGWTAVAIVLVLLSAMPASADSMEDGEVSGKGLSVLQTLLIFVGIPAALFLIITLLVLAPGMARGPRYRPGLGWWAAPVWFNGPPDADTAVPGAVPTSEAGGSSARW